MQIHGFQKLTLLDYPGHIAATIFLAGCNMRCPFCHNASLVTRVISENAIPQETVLSTLYKRKHILEGVCITGGEPTLYPGLQSLIEEIKSIGLKVKLDSNGTNPAMLKHLVQEGLIDYIAMDIKNSKEKYALTTGIPSFSLDKINESIEFLLTSSIAYEFRTTIVKEFHSIEDIVSIGKWINGATAYYLQGYKDSSDMIQTGLNPHTTDTLIEFTNLLKPYITNVFLRGIT
jgi:pyruvate formate lyase activating enzyme